MCGSRYRKYKKIIKKNFEDHDNDDEDDKDHYSCNSVNSQARTSRFCMEVDLRNTYNMILIKIMMMMMMMKVIIDLTQAILKLGPPDFVWKYIHIIPRIKF